MEKKSFQLSFERREWAGWSDNRRQTVLLHKVFLHIRFNVKESMLLWTQPDVVFDAKK